MPNKPQPPPVAEPHSEELERAVIGAMQLDAGAAETAARRLRPESFYVPAAADVFRAAKAILDSGRAPDAALLADELQRVGKWDRVCGAAYLDGTIDSVPTVAQLDAEIDTLLAYEAKRHGIREMRAVAVGLRDGSVDCIEAAARLSALAAAIVPGAPPVAAADVLEDLIDGPEVGTVRLPLGELEEWLGPIFPGQKVIIAGQTSVGKTALLVTLWVACLQRGIACAYLSLEDSEQEIVSRATGALTWLTWGAVLARRWSGDEAKSEARRVARWLRTTDGALRYLPGCSRTELASAVSQAVTRAGAKIVIVDYVQAVGDDGTSRNQQIARTLGELSRAAKPTACLVVGSQLNRGATAGDAKPGLHHLRDSGVLEQDARAVILLSQQGDEVNDADGKPVRRGVALDVAKNKTGRRGQLTGTLWLRHSCLWTGTVRPSLRFEADEEVPRPADDVPHPAEQMEMGGDDEPAF